MPLYRITAAVFLFLFLVAFSMVFITTPVAQVVEDGRDPSIKPGDDFYRYANGGWLKTAALPTGQSSFDTRAILAQRTSQRVRDLIQGAAVQRAARGTISQKVGDYYASFMDEDAIEAKGLTPLAEQLNAISQITTKTSLSAYLGTTLNTEVDGLTTNADHVFGLWINQGFEDAEHNVVHIWQGGIGMPERSSYLDASPTMVEKRDQYRAHV